MDLKSDCTRTPLASALYTGWVRHRRVRPHPHAFRYRICYLLLDLAELERVFQNRWLWSVGRRNLAQFRRSDYLGDPAVPLDEAVRRRAAAVLGRRPEGSIRLLTQVRTFGHCFNPVSFYYCYAAGGSALECVVAEITNTPWKERHSYVLDVAAAQRRGSALTWEFPKSFHVSPFLPMQRDYAWHLQPPGEALRIHMDVRAADGKDFDATLVLERRALDGGSLARYLWRYPLMSLRIVLAIHWQAFLIWLARNPVYDHPRELTGKQE
jgi:DUF1365 family protein